LFPAQTHMYTYISIIYIFHSLIAGGNQNGKKNENHGW
jgi:hypothetical protein